MSRTALVTGGAIRIGREICLSLAEEGWDVAIHYGSSHDAARELEGKLREMGRKVYLVQADLCDERAVSSIIPTLAEQGVHIDALIHNASVFEKGGLASLQREEFDRHMYVNCFSALQLMRDFASHYKGEKGNVITITDGLKGWSISPVFLSYSLSKLALENATELLAVTLGPRIRINTIAPGPMLEGVQDKENTFAKLRDLSPLKRTASPEDLTSAIRYLLNAPSITGQILRLSNGVGAIGKSFE